MPTRVAPSSRSSAHAVTMRPLNVQKPFASRYVAWWNPDTSAQALLPCARAWRAAASIAPDVYLSVAPILREVSPKRFGSRPASTPSTNSRACA